jgi:hypothetical protein
MTRLETAGLFILMAEIERFTLLFRAMLTSCSRYQQIRFPCPKKLHASCSNTEPVLGMAIEGEHTIKNRHTQY